MKIKNIKLKLLSLFSIGIGIFVLMFLITTSWIANTVKTDCQQIEEQTHLACVDSFILKLQDEEISLKQRNHYVWLLGQLGDEKALPTLKKYYTGDECDHEKYLCQYELKKAINLIESQNNIVQKIWGY